MASNVVIVHNNRKYTVKTTPSMLCRDILVQGCEKVGLKTVENYGLKLTSCTNLTDHRDGKKTIDLALPVRLTGLLPGTKLEIYKISASEGIPSREVTDRSVKTDYLGFAMLKSADPIDGNFSTYRDADGGAVTF